MSILNLFKSRELVLISKNQHFFNIYSFDFVYKSPLNWKAGQHGLFSFKGEKLNGGNTRMFSIASSFEENIVKIATKIEKNPSAFKLQLKNMEVGDKIYLRGPLGSFYIPNFKKDIVLIAGGIGITPMRSILLDLRNRKIAKKVSLFYVSKNQEYLFKEDLDSNSLINDKVNIKYLKDRNDLDLSIAAYLNESPNNSIYFISGSPSMVNDVRDKLMSKGVLKQNIKRDNFRGY